MVYSCNYRFYYLFDFKINQYDKLAMDLGSFAFMDWYYFCYLLYFICSFSLDVFIQDDDREISIPLEHPNSLLSALNCLYH